MHAIPHVSPEQSLIDSTMVVAMTAFVASGQF